MQLTRRDALMAGALFVAAGRREFNIVKFGAQPDGNTCTAAIRDAIRACATAGGGRVVVPEGRFVTGAVHLESNVELHLAQGSTLAFSRDTQEYPLVFTRFEGTECMNYSPFIYAFGKENIAVTGPGTLDGQAGPEHWWPWKKLAEADRKALVRMGDSDVPVEQRVFGKGHYLRPNFVQPYRCRNVRLEGFKVVNSPMWELNPVLCSDVVVRGVQIDSHGPNNDGCDPECCRNVLIENCTFSTGDDCIAVKSGRNRDGRRINTPCENVTIRSCEMKDGHGGVSIGSEVSGGIRNVVVEHCRMSSPHLQRALRIKTNAQRGGVIEGIHFENVQVGQVAESVVEVDFYYEEGAAGPFRPEVKDIYIANVSCNRSKYGIFLRGFPNAPISGVHISDCDFRNAAQGNVFENVSRLDIQHVMVNGEPVTSPKAG